jgi:transcriptional regulator with XRE-family HTH domain
MTPARQARRAIGLRATDVARMLGISASYVRAAEAGTVHGYGIAERLASLYGIPVDAFLFTPPAASGGRQPAKRAQGRPGAKRLPAAGVRSLSAPSPAPVSEGQGEKRAA